MTCRHSPGDPDCGNSAAGRARAEARSAEWSRKEAEKKSTADRAWFEAELAKIASVTPDADNYDIVKNEVVGAHLVLQVKYPNCVKCAFEGLKTMVFLNVSPLEAMRWRRIDPHFRAAGVSTAQMLHVVDPKQAPSPAARFPGTPEGWQDALTYAKMKA